MKNIIFVIVMFIFNVCSFFETKSTSDFISMLPESFEYYVYGNYQVVNEKTISKNDHEYQILLKRLKADKDIEPKITLISYVPVVIYKADKILINLTPTSVVINYQTESGDWNQVIINEK